jgi:hypothetical protein
VVGRPAAGDQLKALAGADIVLPPRRRLSPYDFPVTKLALPLLLALAPVASGAEPPFLVTALWEPAHGQRPAAVALRFAADADDLRVNREPAPRLEWPLGMAAKPAAAPAEARPAVAGDPDEAQYLAPGEPFRLYFAAPPGRGTVEPKAVFFYCSKSAGWCKKGVVPVPVVLP